MTPRYEVRSMSGTAWWRTNDLEEAYHVLRVQGEPSDYVYDTILRMKI